MSEGLDGGLAVLRLRHDAHDLRERRVGADGGDEHVEHARAVDRAAHHAVASTARLRLGFGFGLGLGLGFGLGFGLGLGLGLGLARRACGTLSPVIMLSSTALAPKSTWPSTGTCEPGSTLTTSPRRRPATGTSCGSVSMSLHVSSCSAVGGTCLGLGLGLGLG